MLEAVIIAIVLLGTRQSLRDVPFTGDRGVDVVGSILSVLGMGGLVLGILAWQEGGESVAALLVAGLAAMAALVRWLLRRNARASPPCSTRTCSEPSCSASGSPPASSRTWPWAGC